MRAVGVLVFVDEQIGQLLLPARAHFFIGRKQALGQKDQVVEIERIEIAQTPRVSRIQLCGLQFLWRACGGERLLRIEAVVLGLADEPAQKIERIRFQSGRRQILDQGEGVVGVEDRETTTQPDVLRLLLHHAQAERMEGRDLQGFGGFARDQLADALAHLLRGLVGEGDGRDGGRGMADAQQVRDLLGDHARLSGTGAGEHEQGTIAIGDGFALGGIEAHGGTEKRPRILAGHGGRRC